MQVSVPPVCKRLRSKGTPGIVYEDAVCWQSGFVPTANFWCTATAEAVGPDDNSVHPHVCVAGRACFAAPPSPLPQPPGGTRR